MRAMTFVSGAAIGVGLMYLMDPDQNVVDEIGAALGVPRAPDEPFRPSTEILEGRDRYRAEEEE